MNWKTYYGKILLNFKVTATVNPGTKINITELQIDFSMGKMLHYTTFNIDMEISPRQTFFLDFL